MAAKISWKICSHAVILSASALFPWQAKWVGHISSPQTLFIFIVVSIGSYYGASKLLCNQYMGHPDHTPYMWWDESTKWSSLGFFFFFFSMTCLSLSGYDFEPRVKFDGGCHLWKEVFFFLFFFSSSLFLISAYFLPLSLHICLRHRTPALNYSFVLEKWCIVL